VNDLFWTLQCLFGIACWEWLVQFRELLSNHFTGQRNVSAFPLHAVLPLLAQYVPQELGSTIRGGRGHEMRCVALVLTFDSRPLDDGGMSQAATKSATIHIRTSPQHKRLLEQAAKLRQIGLSQFVLESSTQRAREEIASTTLFPLGAKQWEAFCRRLDEPAREKPNLRRLLTEPGIFDA
jgi:uncharacterized protein (DUF1778 family)